MTRMACLHGVQGNVAGQILVRPSYGSHVAHVDSQNLGQCLLAAGPHAQDHITYDLEVP
jgi:hypothetical protein